MDEKLKHNFFAVETWIRFLFMLAFALFLQVAAAVMWVIVVVQLVFVLFAGEPNANLKRFSSALATYIYQCWQFLNFNSNEKPYPFQDWPSVVDQES